MRPEQLALIRDRHWTLPARGGSADIAALLGHIDAVAALVPPGPPLDVDVLARSLFRVTVEQPGLLSDVDMLNDPAAGDTRPAAEAIAAAYAALTADGSPIIPERAARPLTAVELEREAHRLEALALHERFKRGEITEPQYERLRADIGKEPDDLTRMDA